MHCTAQAIKVKMKEQSNFPLSRLALQQFGISKKLSSKNTVEYYN